jgi:DNA-binding IclR family transcriptional regulator
MTLRETILTILEPGEWMTVRAIWRAHGKGARASTRNMLAALERAGRVMRDPREGAATLWRLR